MYKHIKSQLKVLTRKKQLEGAGANVWDKEEYEFWSQLANDFGYGVIERLTRGEAGKDRNDNPNSKQQKNSKKNSQTIQDFLNNHGTLWLENNIMILIYIFDFLLFIFVLGYLNEGPYRLQIRILILLIGLD